MKRVVMIIFGVLGLLDLAKVCSSQPLPSGDIFSLGKVSIGTTTFADLQEILGKSPSFRSGPQDESPLQICYVTGSSTSRAYALFESGAMGGFSRVTGFTISTRPPARECRTLQSSIQGMSSGNGVTLGQSREDFLSKFAIKFTAHGDDLLFQVETKRPANADELIRLRKAWPNEKSYQLDVVVSIRAHFDGGHLSKYDVSKIESY